ncbi:MAG TPA: FKBP-type peptidyl-prolyl cis-trans isomerase [Steroidobacteraceae bacterium]|nr:FKBP-type peptidyl-prolyl cis-trans isomerase [Steroidobacteraceae bacterium]
MKPPPAIAPGADPGPGPTPEQISYLLGLIFGAQMHATGIGSESVMSEAVDRGIKDGLQGKQPTPADQQQVQAYARSMTEAMAARNASAAKDFLARNGKQRGIVTTASGLQYKILAAGEKKAPPILPADTVTVDYRGKLMNGTEFDSSYSRGMPATFPVNGVIKGWQEALVLMKPGAKWQLFVPPELAYGPRSKAKIPPNSLLIFDVNLESVEPANAPPKAPPGTPPPHAPVQHK